MQTKTIAIAAVIIAVTAAIAIGPSLTGFALARKIPTCKVGGSDVDCSDVGAAESGTPSARHSCTAGEDGAQPNCHGAKP